MNSETKKFNERLADLNALGSAMGMMEWDQQTYMPRGGAEARANHLESLSRMYHELFTSDETQDLLVKAAAVAETDVEKANIRIVARQMAVKTKLPSELVAAKTKLAAVAHEEWVAAKANNRFSTFSDTLEKMFDIVKEEANYLGYTDHPY
ncbi:MAG TPA: hypothetical protein VK171_08100, partial [Fimbriimonas sp.]|nr:hypothetical protein [Fimbriimonas sp.]